MKRNSMAKGISIAILALALTAAVTGCGREQRQGATDIRHNASDRGVVPNATGNMHGLGNHYNQGGTAWQSPGPYNTPMAPLGNANNANNLENAQSIAEAVEAMDGIKSANVFVAGRTAFVGCGLHPGAGVTNGNDPSTNNRTITDVSDQLKTQIADKVKSVNPNVDNVYVSANPDFVQRMGVYAQDIKNGKPVSGFVKEFYTMVERIFPYRAGTPGR
ncbi:YhcN/YlaJ family sporulation lipoprotein [Paenibacillus sp. MBLB4367]|uniref:YhcN/YlaJ family sporulation lipoprotein n=1 Tax=Paenibacillus sp. MBLB4367 TaxID=3384767 RepID=UPI0039081AA4